MSTSDTDRHDDIDVREGRPSTWLAHPTGRGTLGRLLVWRVVGVVILLAIVLAAASSWGTHRILVNQLDQQIDAAAARQVNHSPDVDDGTRGPAPGSDVLGNSVGSIFITRFASGAARASIVAEGKVDQAVAQSAVSELLSVSSDSRKHDVELDGLGHYRVLSETRDGATFVVALPLSHVDKAITSLLALEAVVTVLAIGTAVLLCRAVVVRTLKPLNQLASTATEVSELDLDTGEVNLPVRVAPELTDPRTEVGQVGYAFNHMLNNVEGALAARQRSETKVRQFVADASHELRNPLASIRGYAELTRRSGEVLPPHTDHAMTRIEAESARMSTLVEDMLLLARLDNDQKLELVPVDLVELVLNAVSDTQAAGPDHTWSLDLPEDEVMVEADHDRLVQVVVNVLSNARKHTPPGTKVHTSVRSANCRAVVTVADNGPGIPESVRDTVFERFSRADAARTASKEGSTGLGMSIVAAVMEAHHGSAEVDSSDAGTTVTLRLPLA
ncbi:sensor histidine kinase [Acidipropionibacterium timonense]|uniref:sensor histidine kinase n=1 Tax=Acidipropionibacterium timonense TaxID=2161818 RepID=UPI001FDA9F36|nr:HAMP domain-containing sensor histidine kinase [Acidipropionibacterium timonense]